MPRFNFFDEESAFRRPWRRGMFAEPEPQNMFLPNQEIIESQPMQRSNPYRNILDELMGDSPALDEYEEHIRTIPEYEKPSKGRRIFASIAGGLSGLSGGPGAGMATAEYISRKPYREEMEQWQTKGAGLKEAAAIEASRDSKRSNYLNTIFENEQANRKLDQGDTEIDIKGFDAETRRKREQLREKRDAAQTDNERRRLDAEINNWDATRKNERARINLTASEGAANRKSREGIADKTISSRERIANLRNNRPATAQQLQAERRLAESEVLNEIPDDWFDGENLRPEYRDEFEMAIQGKIAELRQRNRRTGDIELPSEEDEFELEEIR